MQREKKKSWLTTTIATKRCGQTKVTEGPRGETTTQLLQGNCEQREGDGGDTNKKEAT